MREGRGPAFAVSALGLSLLVFLPWLGFDLHLEAGKSALNDYWKARVPDMVYGRAHRPFVQRTLVPSVIRAVRKALPRWALGALRRTVSGAPLFLPRNLGVLGWEPAFLMEYVIAAALLLAVLATFPFALRRLFEALYDSPVQSFAAPLLATVLLPAFFFDRGTHYLYDFSTLLLFTLGLALLAEERVAPYYAVLVLGALNKETTILLVPVFAASLWGRWSGRRIAAHLAAQLALVGGILWALARLYAHNPGGAAEWHLDKNLRLMQAPPSLASVAMLLSASVLVSARPGNKPRLLVRGALLVLPPLLASYVFFGIYGEIRVFYEAYPILFLLAFDNACAALGRPLVAREGRAIVATAS